MGLFKKRAVDPAEMERLKAEIAAMAARLEAADQRLDTTDRRLADADTAKTELGAQVRGIVTRLDTPIAPPHEPPSRLEPPPPPLPTINPAELTALRDRLEDLAADLAGVDARITAVSTELAHQIDELSGEFDAAGNRTPPTDEVVDELRDAQTRLANEQARYQIAFRQDLANLADQLRRH